MEELDERHDDRILLTQEEKASLTLLEPLFARHRDFVLDILSRDIRSDPDGASLLSDDLASARLKQLLQEYPLFLLNGESRRSLSREGGQAADDRDPFGLDAGWHLSTSVQFLISIQPLVFDAFGARPRLYHAVWNALLKVIFHDMELAMSASLEQRDELVEAARQEANEAKRSLELVLNKQMADESQRQAEHRTVVNLLTTWLANTSELAQEMGNPLNVILGQAELLLEKTEDNRTQAALQSIVRQVERLIPLRQQLCALNHRFNSKPPAPDRKPMVEESPAGTEPAASTTDRGA